MPPLHEAVEPTLIVFPFLSAIEDSKVGLVGTPGAVVFVLFGINVVISAVVCVGAIQSPLVSI